MTLPEHLFKLRLTVARYGEMDGASWWNTQGILGSAGRSALARGFPKTHYFAQSRIACAVASARCEAVFAPPGCLTLWKMPAEVEDQIASAWPQWCRNLAEWQPFFDDLVGRKSGDLIGHLLELNLIDAAVEEAVKPLRRSAEGKSVSLPGTGKADLQTAMLLAAGFGKGEKGSPAVPYIRIVD